MTVAELQRLKQSIEDDKEKLARVTGKLEQFEETDPKKLNATLTELEAKKVKLESVFKQKLDAYREAHHANTPS
jgi:hypothetical protein